MTNNKLIDAEPEFLWDKDGLVIKKTQEITDAFLASTADARLASSNNRAGEMHRVAAIPTGVVEKWQREGFDIMTGHHTAKEIRARLIKEGLSHFLTTTKAL